MDPPTRSNLLMLKSRIKRAYKGHSLLKRKQDVLMREFFERVREYRAYKSDIHTQLKEAYRSLSLDIAYSGIFVSKSVSYATRNVFDISLDERNLMGVRIPEIVITRLKHPMNAYESAPLLAEAARKFRDLFEKLARLASMELVIQRLGEEIIRTKRRVNSLEHIQIPSLEARARAIRFALDEQERESFTRLKMIKKRIQSQE